MRKSWIIATVFGALIALLYMYQTLGISVFIVSGVAVYGVYTFRKEAKLPIDFKFYVISSYMMILSLNFAITNQPTIRFYSGLIGFTLLLTLCFSEVKFRWPTWAAKGILYFLNAIAMSFSYFNHGSQNLSQQQKYLRQVLLGLVIALPIVFVAIILLSSADVLFSEALGDMFELLEFGSAMEVVLRIVTFILIASVSYGMSLYMIKTATEEKTLIDETSNRDEAYKILPPVVAATILIALNTVYISFAYFQIRFLYFADQTTLLDSYDYATYARQGFFELLTLSLLNTMGILVIHKLVKSNLWVQIGLTITVICTYIMMISSFYKMYLYESTYGYTRLRLYVYLILIFMAIFMGLILVGIWRLKFRSIEYGIIIGLCYYVIISFVNIDAMIVTNNIHHYEMTGELDLYYLTSLSEDGVKVLAPFMETHSDLLPKEEVEAYDFWLAEMTYPSEKEWFFEKNIRKIQAVTWKK